ncbi:hypothetical protein ACSSV1_001901 [Labrenzia sp. MBR-25]
MTEQTYQRIPGDCPVKPLGKHIDPDSVCGVDTRGRVHHISKFELAELAKHGLTPETQFDDWPASTPEDQAWLDAYYEDIRRQGYQSRDRKSASEKKLFASTWQAFISFISPPNFKMITRSTALGVTGLSACRKAFTAVWTMVAALRSRICTSALITSSENQKKQPSAESGGEGKR